MSTMGLGVAVEEDVDGAEQPPRQRAFKLVEAFVLIDGEELLVMVDGMRVGAVQYYLQQLLQRADQAAAHSAFELLPVDDASRVAVLEEEGVKSLTLSGVITAAEVDLDDAETGAGRQTGAFWNGVMDNLRDLFELEAKSAARRRRLAESWGEFNVTTTIQAKGGSRADEVVLDAMRKVGVDLIEDAPAGMDLTITTLKNSKVTPSELTLGKYVTLHRREGRNDFLVEEAWGELDDYRRELKEERRWPE